MKNNKLIGKTTAACIAAMTALLLSACCVYHVSSTSITYTNDSSHYIEFSLTTTDDSGAFVRTTDIALKPAESYTFDNNIKGGGYISPHIITGDCRTVVFDNETAVNHYGPNRYETDGIKEHSICDDESYECDASGRHDYNRRYTYTFTDEDYDRAAAANAE